jgi:type IV secretion system protein VirD4
VSSVAPIKATKLRYYADANFKHRVLPPPALADGQYADAPLARADDWSGLAIPAVPTPPAAGEAEGFPASTDDGGPRRQPELSETVAYDPELAAPAADLALLDDDDDLPLPFLASLIRPCSARPGWRPSTPTPASTYDLPPEPLYPARARPAAR